MQGIKAAGCSADDRIRLWYSLIDVAEKVSNGEINVDKLAAKLGKRKLDDTYDLDHGKNNNVVHKDSRFKLNYFKFIKKSGETSTACQSISNLDGRNPISPCRRRKGPSERRAHIRREPNIINIVARAEPEPEPEPVLPEAFRNYISNIGGCLESVVLVLKKVLSHTDLSKTHGRLSLPLGKLKHTFLHPGEIKEMRLTGIRVTLIQPCLEECQLNLKDWSTNSTYVLTTGWKKVCRRNRLRPGMNIELWSFRRNSSLGFALLIV